MKILIVVQDLNIGGVTSSAKNFYRECSVQGNQVDFLVMNNEVAKFKGVNQIFLSGKSRLWNLGIEELRKTSLLKKLTLIPIAIVKKLLNKHGLWLPLVLRPNRAEDYDVVIAYRQCAPCYYYALKCVNAKKKLAMIHGDIEFMGDITSWSHMLRDFDKIACVSNAVEKGFRSHFKMISNKFTTIYNMYDIELMNKLKDEKPLFVPDSSKFNIISICRHENGHKKVNRIVETCAALAMKGVRNLHWYIVGDGPDFESNVQLATNLNVHEYITFCGALDNPFSVLSKCDLCVLTSKTEAYGMCLKESLILGVPIVAMNYPALNEIIEDGKNGLISKQTIDDLSDKVLYLIRNKKILLRMKDYIINQQYSNEIAYNQLINCVSD